MESVLREIGKQSAKIVRILTKVTEQYPETGKQLDLALYAAIRIEKSLGKYIEEGASESVERGVEGVRTERVGGRVGGSDPLLEAAFANIEGFRESTAKLESKINVLINESESHHKHHYYLMDPKPLSTSQPKRLKPARLSRRR
jgi:hypothetical protein